MISIKYIFLLFLLLVNKFAYGQVTPSKIEKQFIYHSKVCEHMAGEISDQSPERSASLNKAMDESCPKAEKLAKKLLKQKNLSQATYESLILMHNVSLKLTVNEMKFFCSKAKSDWVIYLCINNKTE
jgi:hypothetical protein